MSQYIGATHSYQYPQDFCLGCNRGVYFVRGEMKGCECPDPNASTSPPGDDEYGLAKAYEQVADHLPPGWKL